MSDSFNEMSENIAKNFIQSILFVDDLAYKPEQSDHLFDVEVMSKESVARGFLASVYAPENQDDLENIVKVGRKSDVVVLDWSMDINDDSAQSEGDDEEEDTADSRGEFAVRIIKAVIADAQSDDSVNQLKLIFIYTGEIGLQGICDDLQAALDHFDRVDDFTLLKGGIRISIWAKAVLARHFKQMPENRSRLCSYANLLDKVSTEYASVSAGLLSNTCLYALTSLRNNTYKLLANFSPSLDPAFVVHRAMLLKPDDAGDLLKETICGELNSILTNADISARVSSNAIHNWISSQNFVDTEIMVKKGNADSPATTIAINSTKRKLWQDKGYVALLSNEKNKAGTSLLTKKEIDTCERNRLKKHACTSFIPTDFTPDDYNEKFSILTHHKRNCSSIAKNPSLSLGVMIKDDDRYLLCIQQKCDSVRIPDEKHRKFLFLPMKTRRDDQNFDVLFKGDKDYIRLSTCYKECYAIEIIEFTPFKSTGIVQAQEEDGFYYFTGGVNGQIKYQWILDLKEAHAQRIANHFAAQLSRVGLDESEWLRRT